MTNREEIAGNDGNFKLFVVDKLLNIEGRLSSVETKTILIGSAFGTIFGSIFGVIASRFF